MLESTLLGARIWLSGSIPEETESTTQQRQSISDFVREFARFVFQHGGHIVHGSHPSLVPILLEESKKIIEQGGKKDSLILAVSRLWSKDPNIIRLDEWRKYSIVYETPESPNNDREESLRYLREWMVSRSEAVVVVGGKWWKSMHGRAGIPIEFSLAIDKGLPCFLLGGLGGIANDFVKNNTLLLSKLKNGFDYNENVRLALNEDVAAIAEKVCGQLERLPLVRGKFSEGITFRILTLDGGGLKGTFTAAVLASWEQQTGLRVVDHFDLISGTSTGGILAIGLGLGLSGQQMLDFYKKKGPVIFPISRMRSKIKHSLRHIFKPKYAQEILLRELEIAYYENNNIKYLKNSKCRLVIPAYHAISGTSYVFRTPHHPDLIADADTQAAHAALATAAAPTYFTCAQISNMICESSYFDGGVWANSPAMAAVIEAVCFLNIPIDKIDVLSIGTTEEPFTVQKQRCSGVFGWVWKKKILDLLMNVQQESSLKMTKHLVGTPRFLRVDKITQKGSYILDSPDEIQELADLGRNEALNPEIFSSVKSRFLNGIKVSAWDKYDV